MIRYSANTARRAPTLGILALAALALAFTAGPVAAQERPAIERSGVHFSIGAEDAVFLRGEIPVEWVSHDEVDRLLGTLYATVEASFVGLLRIGFASRFG